MYTIFYLHCWYSYSELCVRIGGWITYKSHRIAIHSTYTLGGTGRASLTYGLFLSQNPKLETIAPPFLQDVYFLSPCRR